VIPMPLKLNPWRAQQEIGVLKPAVSALTAALPVFNALNR